MKHDIPGVRLGGFACLLVTLSLATPATAQSVSSAPPNSIPSSAASTSIAPPQANMPTTPASQPGAVLGDETQWRFVGNLALQATYDDNITILPTNEIDDLVFHVAPTVAFGIGNFRTAIAPYAAIPHFIARTGEEDLPRRDS